MVSLKSQYTVHRHLVQCVWAFYWTSLWQSVLSVANVFLVLPSISFCDFPCCVLSIPEYKLVFTPPPSCMAVSSPYLPNAVTFYICPFSAGNFCLILPLWPYWTDWDIPSTCHSLSVHIVPKVVCTHVVLSLSICLDSSLILLRGCFCPVLCWLCSQL